MKLDVNSCRDIAAHALKGKWWKALLTGFVASILGVFTNLVTGVLKLTILSALILRFCESVPFYRILTFVAATLIAFLWLYVGSSLRLGYIDFNLAMLDKRKARFGMLFQSHSSWWNSVAIRLIMMIGTLVGMVFFFIPGIVFYYNHAMAPFLLETMDNITISEALALSKKKMKGFRMELFSLQLSFLGWKILGILTLGIANLWVRPYMAASESVFFNEVSGRADLVYGRKPNQDEDQNEDQDQE